MNKYADAITELEELKERPNMEHFIFHPWNMIASPHRGTLLAAGDCLQKPNRSMQKE